nr:MAG TPA: hypothetical protein [Caudoviricetes sp.]
MEIKIDIKGSNVKLETFLHRLTINYRIIAVNPKRPLKQQIRQTRNRPRRTTLWLIRK